MFKNYIKLTFRNLITHKLFSTINVLGLSLGLALSMLIFLWVQDELMYDSFHEKADSIYRILVNMPQNGSDYKVGVTPAALGPAIQEDLDEIKYVTRYKNWGAWQLKYKDGNYITFDSAVADPTFFDIFTFPLLSGSKETALDDAHKLVLTKSTSEKIFGDINPIGEIVEVKNLGDFTISGIVDDVSHSHFTYDLVASFQILKEYGENIDDFGRGSFNFTTYILLSENVNPIEADKKISTYYQEKTQDPEGPFLFIQALKDIYLRSDFAYDFTRRGSLNTVYVFIAIAFLVLLIACINFMNLTTAKSGNRAKEIGMRKVSGAKRSDLIFQFYGEAMLLTVLSIVIALILVASFIEIFNSIADKSMAITYMLSTSMLFGLITITLITGFISGSYPAIFLSSFNPIVVLKGNSIKGKKAAIFRKILVVFQFSLSIILIISALTVYSQLKYIQAKDLGYNKDHLVFIYLSPTIKQKYLTIKEELLTNSNIEQVTCTDVLPIYACPSRMINQWEGNEDESEITMHFIQADHDYLKTMNIELLEGQDFKARAAGDSTYSFIINEEAVKQMGLKNPVGKTISMGGYNVEIKGVIKNFNYDNIRNEIEPLAIINSIDESRNIFVRIKPQNATETVAFLNNKLKEFDPDLDFKFRFFDQTLDRLYRKEQQIGKIVMWFTGFALFISCLGLFGLASFMTEQRTKEIGIRKVLGSSIRNIVYLLSLDFTKWIIVSNMISWPIAYFLMNKWLTNFAYKTSISPFNFILAGISTLLIALMTISIHTIKAARSNPVEALKYE